MKYDFICIGHRGTRIDYDENTLGAFKKAIEYGADYIELDIHKTKDGKLIIMHDPSLDRTTNGQGLLKDFSYHEIKKLRTKIKNEQIPTLSVLLNELIGRIKFIIELKGENVINELLKLVNERGLQKDCIFSGRYLNELKSIKTTFPESKICYNISKGRDLTLEKFINLGKVKKLFEKPDMISLRSSQITSEFIEICHNNDILALSWDFLHYENPVDKIKLLINMGINGILFDNYKNIPIIRQWLES